MRGGGTVTGLSPTNPFLFICKSVRDEYGRHIGRITSFAITPNGKITGVFIKRGDGEFLRYSIKQVKIEAGGAVLLSPLKMRARGLCNQIPLIWRKDQALAEILEKKKIASQMFTDLHNNFEDALNQLKTDAQATLDNLSKKISRCTLQIDELQSAMVHLELERRIGKIDAKSHETAAVLMQNCFKQVTDEKSDYEAIRKKLSNTLLGEAPDLIEAEAKQKASIAPPPPPSLPEPPVVHVKTMSKRVS
jgi:hypothetical protein